MTKLLIRSISGIKPPRLRAASLFCAAVTVVMLCLSGHAVPAAGAAAGPVPGAAEKIAASLELSGFTDPAKAKDGKTGTFATGKAGATVTVEAGADIGYIYLLYAYAPGPWTVSSGSSSAQADGLYLHECVFFAEKFGASKTAVLSFPSGVYLTAVEVYGTGGLPDGVQVWEPPCEKADILLLSAHSDDEHLYFAGILPYYARVRGAAVQVAYFTEHIKDYVRWHERLNGLWTAGVRHYPVISGFPDALSYDLATAYSKFEKAGCSKDELTNWTAELYRRFRPQVVLAHDLAGEYGHGQHMASADTAIRAAETAKDPSKILSGYPAYDVPKLYVHLYGKEQIVLAGIDEPSPSLGGVTPFAVSQKAYLCHESQFYSDLLVWMYGTKKPVSNPSSVTITKASQIKDYSPLRFGLCRRADGVPGDVAKNDFLENITLYSAGGSPVADTSSGPQTGTGSQTTDVTTPDVTTPDVTTPDVTSPDDTASDITGSDVTGPEVTGPDVTSADPTGPSADTSGGTPSDGTSSVAPGSGGDLKEKILTAVAIAAGSAALIGISLPVILSRRKKGR